MHFCFQNTIFCTTCLLWHSMGKCQLLSKTLYFAPLVYYDIQWENFGGFVNFWAQLYVSCQPLPMDVNLGHSQWTPNATLRLLRCGITAEYFGFHTPNIQLEAEVINPPDVFPLIPIVNKSCNFECCVNNMLQITQNMMVSQCTELELIIFRGTTLSGQHLLI